MSKRRKNKQRIWQVVLETVILICVLIGGYVTSNVETSNNNIENVTQNENRIIDLSTIPEYTSSPYVEINNNIPYFTEEDYTTEPFERYSKWDRLGRSGVAYANVCRETMPKEGEERGEIGSVKDLSGWVQKRYDDLIKDKYLFKLILTNEFISDELFELSINFFNAEYSLYPLIPLTSLPLDIDNNIGACQFELKTELLLFSFSLSFSLKFPTFNSNISILYSFCNFDSFVLSKSQ